jgi:hypothetical protein
MSLPAPGPRLHNRSRDPASTRPRRHRVDSCSHFTCFRNSSFSIFACLRIDQCACGNLGMVRDRHEPPGFRMQEMDMTAGLPYRFETKNGEDFDYFKS